MKKHKKIIVILIIIIAFLSTVATTKTYGAEEDIFKGVDISKNSDGSVIATLSQDQTTLTITGTGEMKDWDYVGLSTRPWQTSIEKITTVKINQGVTSIGNFAFRGLNNLSNVTIPNSVIRINVAFYDCDNLKSIEIPSSVKHIYNDIYNDVFGSCDSLNSINVSKDNTEYSSEGGVLFNKNKTAIIKYPQGKIEKNYIIPNSVTSIENRAFSGCRSLTSIKIPNSVTRLESYAFSSCTSLSSIEIPGSVISVGNNAFDSCKNLNNITIQNGVKKIGGCAFWGCINIENIKFPSSVTSIGDQAFYYCSSRSIEIPSSVTNIYGTRAFSGFRVLITTLTDEINVPDILTKAMNKDDLLYANEKITFTNCILDKNNKIKIDRSISQDKAEISVEIEEGKLSGLKIIIIPTNEDISKNNDGSVRAKISDDLETLTISGKGEMKNFRESILYGYGYKIKKVIIEEGVTNIGDYAFSYSDYPERFYCGLRSIEIPNSVTSIGWRAFMNCHNLESITIPSSISTIEREAFCWCSKLSSINVDSNNKKYSSDEGILFNKDKTTIIAYPANKIESSYKIPSTVVKIECYAFSNCNNLKSLEISNSLNTIDNQTFCGCYSVTDIKIQYGIKSIGIQAFKSCYSLRSIEIPNSVTSIKHGAFSTCSSLSSIEIPNSINSIENDMFWGCRNLSSIIIPKEVTNIGGGAFYDCNNLIITCKEGTTAETYAKEKNIKYTIDNETPEIKEIRYSTKKPTNQDVIVEIEANEDIRLPQGWEYKTTNNKKIITKPYKENIEEELTLLDLVGNEANTKAKVKISNIDKTAPTIEVNTYTVEENIVKNIQANTSYTDFIKNITSNKEIIVKEGNTQVTGTEKIKTGQTLTVGEKSYTLVVIGDTNGDGQADIRDIMQINKHRLNKMKLTGEYLIAGDVNKDGISDIRDIMQINKFRLGKTQSL